MIRLRSVRWLKYSAVTSEVCLAQLRVMYWKEIPVQIQAQDDDGQVSAPLDARFQEAADAVAMFDGSAGTDAYLDGWATGEPVDVEGTAEAAAKSLANKYNDNMPDDFVARIREMVKAGTRDESPGSIDSWAGIELFN